MTLRPCLAGLAFLLLPACGGADNGAPGALATGVFDGIAEGETVHFTGTEPFWGGMAGGGGDVFVHQTQIYARGFRSLAEGEEVEYEVELDESGRQRAISVTGPEGDYVQGAPRPPRADDYDAKYDETY